ncbi:MAG: hypothetical protein Q7S27_06490 [Nanoarchaeota archaeon]|nr:hypothetical protein [Nanoarchaeota archaeon]
MTKGSICLVDKEDDAQLRECMRLNEMPGAISIAFETEPSFFDALSVLGKEQQVVAGKTDDGNLMGFGVRSIREAYVNGEMVDIGYLSSLRGHPKYRGGTFIARGFKKFRELDKDGKVPFYITTIVEDNIAAKKILEKTRVAMPFYYPIDTLSTFLIKPQRSKMKNEYEIFRGDSLSLEEIVEFMNREGKNKQFYPHYQETDFGSCRLRNLEKEDFYIASKDDKIVGVVAKWDQESFKQTRVVDYDKKTKIARAFINLASRFSNIPHLPKAGELLHYFYAAFPTVKDNNPRILKELLSAMASDRENKEYDYFTLGLTEKDPLREGVKSFSPREYKSRIYMVSFDKSRENLKFLNGRIPYLELGTL